MTHPTRQRVIKLYVGAFILLVTGISSILASNIIVSSPSKSLEFGQGEFRIEACDSWVTLNLTEGSTGASGAPEGFSPLTGITIQGLDSKRCANTQFQIGVLDPLGISMPLYRTDGLVQMCVQINCTIDPPTNQQVSLTIDAQGRVALSPPNQYSDLIFDSQNGVYRIAFSQPGILANDVGRLTIQSQGLKI
jgi:hypothetical protein